MATEKDTDKLPGESKPQNKIDTDPQAETERPGCQDNEDESAVLVAGSEGGTDRSEASKRDGESD